ncbi:GNAT family N-acetyltransferase [Paenibacillus sedimenti]|uniref:GNAT family N-acetyltransferase n=1 Tax=Paenibacillus sedimenti TaxID=2770274 RepID=A0A926KRD2_9BACL|nr:GNAT family N-acetyltransferase [Paenibacillus sedimenti]MBD0382102.1 GNAT family N-acetyltransferase [Paenibacillus sedimenti]
MDYVIRQATPQDTNQISLFLSRRTGKAISPLHIENRLHFMRSTSSEWLFVYEEQNEILGTLAFRIRQSSDAHLKISEASLISSDETQQHQIAGSKLREYAEQLANQHECTGLWWVAGLESKNGTHSLSQSPGFQESGYRFVKRFL